MYFSSVGENFLKAQVQNHYEKIRCDLYIKNVDKKHVHSLANLNKSIKEVRDALKDIQSSSGHCNEVQGNETAPKSNVWKEAEGWSTGKNQPNGGHLGKIETQARQKTGGFQEIGSKNLESSVSKMTVGGASRSLFLEKNGGNVVEKIEYSTQGKNGAGGDMNGDRSDLVPAGRLLRDEILMLADSQNVSDRGIKGANKQGSDPSASARNANIKGSQLKAVSSAHGGDFHNTTATKPTTKNLGSLSSRTDIPLESAPRKAMSKGKLKENSRYLPDTDMKKVKIHVSLSKAERKKILQGLISSCRVPCDRSVLEHERQRRLQQKIHRFFELLFEQDEKDDGSDISGDD